MKTKIATSIEQSKKLLDLGLDSDTADMSYTNYKFQTDNYGNLISDSCEPVGGIAVGNMFDDYPAWSLSAFLELMPKNDFTGIDYDNTGGWLCHTIDYVSPVYDTPIDAVYDVVVNLIEQDYIKTEKK